MAEFRDFPLDNIISGYIKEDPAPVITGNGELALDLCEDGDDGPDGQIDDQILDPFAKPLILGPVQQPPPITSPPVNFSYAVERYGLDIRDGFRINSRGRLYADGAETRFFSLHKWLKKHAEKYGEIDLFHLSDAWLKDFVRFLHHQPIALNTVSGLVDNVHAVIGGYITDGLPLKKLTIRVWPEVADAVFNSVDELDMILNAKYSHEALKLVSEIYTMHSFLGFRVGTLQRFLENPQLYLIYQKKKWLIRIRTNKTGAIVVVPVKEIVLDILQRRNYRFEAIYYERYYNRLIKMMAFEAGVTDLVPYSMTVRGRCKEFTEPKCELMSSHTARRNLATNAFLAGVPVDNIMWITGHKTREAFYGYIRADSLANAISISGHTFFQ